MTQEQIDAYRKAKEELDRLELKGGFDGLEMTKLHVEIERFEEQCDHMNPDDTSASELIDIDYTVCTLCGWET